MAEANLVAFDRRKACTKDFLKDWVRESDSGRRDPTDLSKTGTPPSGIAEALSKVLDEQPFSSTKYIAAQLQSSSELVKRSSDLIR
jgi:hypothetical protein